MKVRFRSPEPEDPDFVSWDGEQREIPALRHLFNFYRFYTLWTTELRNQIDSDVTVLPVRKDNLAIVVPEVVLTYCLTLLYRMLCRVPFITSPVISGMGEGEQVYIRMTSRILPEGETASDRTLLGLDDYVERLIRSMEGSGGFYVSYGRTGAEFIVTVCLTRYRTETFRVCEGDENQIAPAVQSVLTDFDWEKTPFS